MSKQTVTEPSRWVALLIVTWPALLWLSGLAVSLAAQSYGCTISARGPEPCIVFGRDYGEFLYPLWALGFSVIYVLLWLPIGLVLLGLLRIAMLHAK